MSNEYMNELLAMQEFNCPVCGTKRYITDHGNHEYTVHCSSDEARFWDFDRGTQSQTVAKQHWDQSRLDMFFTVDGRLENPGQHKTAVD